MFRSLAFLMPPREPSRTKARQFDSCRVVQGYHDTHPWTHGSSPGLVDLPNQWWLQTQKVLFPTLCPEVSCWHNMWNVMRDPLPFSPVFLDLADLRYTFPNTGLMCCWTTTGNTVCHFTWHTLWKNEWGTDVTRMHYFHNKKRSTIEISNGFLGGPTPA